MQQSICKNDPQDMQYQAIVNILGWIKGLSWESLSRSLFFRIEGRYELIDLIRGGLLFWMTIAHILALQKVPENHFLQFLRPSGWSTEAFVMLSGLTIAFINTPLPLAKARKRLWRRAMQLIIIAFLSNLLSLTILNRSLTNILDVLSFRSSWSISQYLLPTVLIAMTGPLLLWLGEKLGYKTCLLATGIFLLISSIVIDILNHNKLLPVLAKEIIFGSRNFQVWIFPFYLAAIWGFLLGSYLFRVRFISNIMFILFVLSAIFLAFSHGLTTYLAAWRLCEFFLVTTSRFLIIFFGGIFLQQFLWFFSLRKISAFLGILGRSSLLVFIIHRPLVHLFERVFFMMQVRSMVVSTLSILLFTMFSLFLLCRLKEKNNQLNASLKRLGF